PRSPLGGAAAVWSRHPRAHRRPDRPLAPELLAGDADHRVLLDLPAVAPQYRWLCRLRARSARESDAPAVPLGDARARARRSDDADDAIGDVRRPERGLRPHRTGKGTRAAPYSSPPRPEERAHRGRHAARDT